MHSITDVEIKSLELKAESIRESIIKMLLEAGSGHTAGPLGMADILTCLYFKLLNHDPKNPNWENRDKFILSNGHTAPVLYAAMAHSGYFPVSELKTLRKFGTRLQGHPHRETLPGIENSSGPLGSGLSQAIGMALADRVMNSGKKLIPKYFYVMMGDGEINEGQVWESLLLLNKYKLNNVITFIDRNTIQIDGFTENVLPLDSIADKMKAFNFNVIEIDGHNMREIVSAVNKAKSILNQSTIIIAHTIPGKGVVEFEGDFKWHGKAPNGDEAKIALKELRTLRGKIKEE